MHSIAYNLVVQVRYLASLQGKIAPKRLSFSGVWNLVETNLLNNIDRTPLEWQKKLEFVLSKCLQRKLPNRPGRSYPREAYRKRATYPVKKKKTEDELAK